MNSEEAKQMFEAIASATDQILKDSIIGSKILGFEIEKISGTKRMYKLTLRTDAKPVKIGQAVYLMNELSVKVKL